MKAKNVDLLMGSLLTHTLDDRAKYTNLHERILANRTNLRAAMAEQSADIGGPAVDVGPLRQQASALEDELVGILTGQIELACIGQQLFNEADLMLQALGDDRAGQHFRLPESKDPNVPSSINLWGLKRLVPLLNAIRLLGFKTTHQRLQEMIKASQEG